MKFKIKDFRSIGYIEAEFKNGTNVIVAPNKTGKTNLGLGLMRACTGVCSNGEAHFDSPELIRDGMEAFELDFEDEGVRIFERYWNNTCRSETQLEVSWQGEELKGTPIQLRNRLAIKYGMPNGVKKLLKEAFMLRLFITPDAVSLVSMEGSDRLSYLLALFGIEALLGFKKRIQDDKKALAETQKNAALALLQAGSFTDLTLLEEEYSGLLERTQALDNPAVLAGLKESYARDFKKFQEHEQAKAQRLVLIERECVNLPVVSPEEILALEEQLKGEPGLQELETLRNDLRHQEKSLGQARMNLENLTLQINGLKAQIPDLGVLGSRLTGGRKAAEKPTTALDILRQKLVGLRILRQKKSSAYEGVLEIHSRALASASKFRGEERRFGVQRTETNVGKLYAELEKKNVEMAQLGAQLKERRHRCPYPSCGREIMVLTDRLAPYDEEILVSKAHSVEQERDHLKDNHSRTKELLDYLKAQEALEAIQPVKQEAQDLAAEIEKLELEEKNLEADVAVARGIEQLWLDWDRAQMQAEQVKTLSAHQQSLTVSCESTQSRVDNLRARIVSGEAHLGKWERLAGGKKRMECEARLVELKDDQTGALLAEQLEKVKSRIDLLEENQALFERKAQLERELFDLRAKNQLYFSFEEVRKNELKARSELELANYVLSDLKTLLPQEIMARKNALEHEINICAEVLGLDGKVEMDLDMSDEGNVKSLSLFRRINGRKEDYRARLSTGERAVMRTAIAIGLRRAYPVAFNGLDFVIFDDPGLGVHGAWQEKFYQGISSLLSGKVIVMTAYEPACELLQPVQVIRLKRTNGYTERAN